MMTSMGRSEGAELPAFIQSMDATGPYFELRHRERLTLDERVELAENVVQMLFADPCTVPKEREEECIQRVAERLRETFE